MAADLTPCVFCGTPRPRDVSRCPTCRRGWVDAYVVAPVATDPAPAGGNPAPAVPSVPAPDTDPGDGTEGAASVDGPDAPAAVEGDDAPPTDPAGAAAAPPPVVPPAQDQLPGADADGGTGTADPAPAPDPVTPAAGTAASTPAPPSGPPDDRPGGRPPDGRPDSRTPSPPAVPPPPGEPGSEVPSHDEVPARRRNRLRQRLLMAGVVVALVAGWFGVLAWITSDDPAGDEASPGTTLPAAPAPQEVAPTTLPEPTTTTTPEPTTTTADPAVLSGPFPEVGNPVDLIDLRLGAFAVGPIDFGDPDGLGRLVASLGQPGSARTVEDGSLGLCPGEPGFTASWGPFTALFAGTPDDGTLVGYRLDSEPPAHPTAGMSTLSQLSLGDSVADLEALYPDFDISYEEIDGTLSFVLVRSDGVTLLWGPVSAGDPDGTVLGIYSPEPCSGGPVPSG